MKLKEIIANLDKSNKNSSSVDIDRMINDMGIYGFISQDADRLKAYYFLNWQCTDTFVGGRAYFFDDELVATSWQDARKSYEDFEWVSKDAYKTVKNYLLSLIEENEQHIDIVDLEQEFGEGYPVSYSSQVITDSVIYKPTGETVKVIKKYRDMEDIKKWSYIQIRYSDGRVEEVRIEEILVPYNLKK